ncbi:hypothetical protein LMUP508_01623 [Limosilactobacillus mucosae]|uniref:Uncharacterized protein n=1 Tax=Limosilactobacillus mucosae TaxID=97478 RepID=A0A508YPZ0_LIMMU|nr:hypothetical protein [Limosilactobacillus mucosae]VTZ92158.1 hypothetical protein LMUP508_01623 [Limosilactobacillus mucosae]
MQTPRLPKYLMLSSFALLTATTSLIFNNHEIKADTAENKAATAVSTTVSNTVVLKTDAASSAVADYAASLSDSASSAASEQRASSSADVLTEVTTPDTGNVTQSDASWTLKGLATTLLLRSITTTPIRLPSRLVNYQSMPAVSRTATFQTLNMPTLRLPAVQKRFLIKSLLVIRAIDSSKHCSFRPAIS